MKHFITFQKKKGLYLPEKGNPTVNGRAMAMKIQHEMIAHGFVFTQECFTQLESQSEQTLHEVFNDLKKGLERVVGSDGYEPIYRNFPQSVKEMSYLEFLLNAIIHYWSMGTWRPEDEGHLEREFKIEPVDYKEVKLLTETQYMNILYDIIYSGDSISSWDKEIINYFIENEASNVNINFGAISFKETKAYIGKRMLDSDIDKLPVRNATDVLRIYSAYCGGDEGLKENTKFKAPTQKQRRILRETLDNCYNLEDSFKTYREKWLKFLFRLNPMTKENAERYPTLYRYTNLLRNSPKSLRTFNSYVEHYIENKDEKVFELLSKRKGVFMRRLDHLVRVFDSRAVQKFVDTNPRFDQLITVYNHFSSRDKSNTRSAILASSSSSTMVQYKELEALDPAVVERIQTILMDAMTERLSATKIDKKVFIDRSLYYSPLQSNNRASSLSLNSAVKGEVQIIPEGKVVRAYVHWNNKWDIDLSAMMITHDMNVLKIGWNGQHVSPDKGVVYSGDNTGHSSKNAEYIDLELDKLQSEFKWVIFDAKVYRGRPYSSPNWDVKAGWMLREHPEANRQWLPDTIENAVNIQCDSNSAYLFAIHVESRNIVFLDISQTESRITTSADALKMCSFLNNMIVIDEGDDEIKWDKIAQGHVLNLMASQVVSDKEEAEIVFDENTPWETVSRAINEEAITLD